MNESIRIFPLGDTALTVEFGNGISVDLNTRSIALSDYFEQNPFAGFIETVPAYATTTIFYDPTKVKKASGGNLTAFETVRRLVAEVAADPYFDQTKPGRHIEIPVRFDEESGFDLGYVAGNAGVSIDETTRIFTSTEYRVFMLGFLPGFSYMGEVDERIATPRKDSPRTLVPKGSVAIAGRQTGIYSLDSPGGWQIIGRTEVEMFRPRDEIPSFLRAGDIVRFVDVRD